MVSTLHPSTLFRARGSNGGSERGYGFIVFCSLPWPPFRTCGKQLCWYLPISRIWRTVCLRRKSPNTSPWVPSKTTPGTYSPAVHLQERGKRYMLMHYKLWHTAVQTVTLLAGFLLHLRSRYWSNISRSQPDSHNQVFFIFITQIINNTMFPT